MLKTRCASRPRLPALQLKCSRSVPQVSPAIVCALATMMSARFAVHYVMCKLNLAPACFDDGILISASRRVESFGML